MPFTFRISSFFPNGPFCARYSIILAAVAGPMPFMVIRSTSAASLMFTQGASVVIDGVGSDDFADAVDLVDFDVVELLDFVDVDFDVVDFDDFVVVGDFCFGFVSPESVFPIFTASLTLFSVCLTSFLATLSSLTIKPTSPAGRSVSKSAVPPLASTIVIGVEGESFALVKPVPTNRKIPPLSARERIEMTFAHFTFPPAARLPSGRRSGLFLRKARFPESWRTAATASRRRRGAGRATGA